MQPQNLNPMSREKIDSLIKMAKALQIEIVAKQRIDENGFIENMVMFYDREKYPTPEPAPTPETKEPVAPETPKAPAPKKK